MQMTNIFIDNRTSGMITGSDNSELKFTKWQRIILIIHIQQPSWYTAVL